MKKQRIPRWAERYAQLRFKDGGREFPNVDCWGAPYIVLAERAGIKIQSYGDTKASDLLAVARSMQADSALPPWLKVETPRELDIVTMVGNQKVAGRNVSAVCHVGIMVNDTHMLHIERMTDAVIVPLDHPSVKPRIVGFYRHEALA